MSLIQVIAFLITGFLLGLKHSLDTDHLAAVSTIVSRNSEIRKSALQGALWGMGHTATLLVVGFFILIFKLSMPYSLSHFFELIVGFVLVYLGISLAFRVKREKIHLHAHEHNGHKHIHLHSHKESLAHKHPHQSFLVGLVHGLAGSAALMLIVLSTAKSAIVGFLFILIFGLGSILGMTLFGLLTAIPLALLDKRLKLVNRGLKFVIASASIAIGLSIILQSI